MKPNLTKAEVEFTTDLLKKAQEYKGKKVTVYVGGKERSNFDNQISVSGTLEEHPDFIGAFRVLDPKDDGTFTYFSDKTIRRIVAHESHTFRNGAVAIIQIEVKTEF